MRRTCSKCDAPTWSKRSPYCLAHRPDEETRRRQAERSRAARGYGKSHKQRRAGYARLVKAGLASCCRCHEPIRAGEPWDLDHSDDRSSYLGPAHARCNRQAAAGLAAGSSSAGQAPVIWSRRWYEDPPFPVIVMSELGRNKGGGGRVL